MMENLISALRYKVSADKHRYLKGNYDLDLTYITDRIIAMSFPAEGVESTYRNKIDDVAKLLHENHSTHFYVYNLSERIYDHQKFDMQVLDCGFPDHHAPPLEQLFQIVKNMQEKLKKDKDLVVVVHCLAGKGRTGTIIASYFLYAGLFDDPHVALNYFATKRSVNNWGVTGPSQLRYVQHFSNILNKGLCPYPKKLKITKISFNSVPSFNYLSITGGKSGCTPYVNIYSLTTQKRQLIFTSEKEGEEFKSYSSSQRIEWDLSCNLCGDIVIEVYHVSPFYRSELMLRLQFHTSMLQDSQNELKYLKSDLDVAYQDKRFPPNFAITLSFEKVEEKPVIPEHPWWEWKYKGEDGSICFFDHNKLQEVKEMSTVPDPRKIEKGGWLTKRGHTVKNWKRRWFVLRDPNLTYYKSPRDTQPAGWVVLEQITTIVTAENYRDSKPLERQNWFEIKTEKNSLLVCADTEEEMRDWIEAIEFVRLQSSNRITEPKGFSKAVVEEDLQCIEDNLKIVDTLLELNLSEFDSDQSQEDDHIVELNGEDFIKISPKQHRKTEEDLDKRGSSPMVELP